MKIASALLIAGLALVPQAVQADTDCNQLARDIVRKDFRSSWSEYSKLLFLSMLSQMTVQEGQEALNLTGEVSVGPIKIGPGSWNEQKKNELRMELQKYVRIESLTQSAASVVSSSGDSNAEQAIEACIQANSVAKGGLFATLKDKGKDTAVFEVIWASAPGAGTKTATIEDVTIDPEHGRIIGGNAKKGAVLHDRLGQNVQIKRNPTKDLLVTLNLKQGGAVDAYVPPAVLPPPPTYARVMIQANPTGLIGSGGRYDGDRNPGCQAHSAESCVKPQLGGKIVKGSGKPFLVSQNGRGGTSNEKESEDRYCVTFWTATTACENVTTINGYASAVEEYLVKTYEPGKEVARFLESE
ncbi:hypothetical protein QIH96_39885 [Bradyrhizobium japonicum]|uniref:hypothetical protein n=1 Tax=Bradyrhizobium japonicum TaxID=375 RepID=UPI002714FF84|nr:hypothetical protein [Bradyrhizobium japonicum]WLB62589.1 hypothetical protein QIH96_39885 [Bradyrhizobium japonicum]